MTLVQLEQAVLDCLRQHGPMSGNRIAARMVHRKGDVLEALRRLERRGRVGRTPGHSDRSPTGSWHVSDVSRSKLTRPRRPDDRISVPTPMLEAFFAGDRDVLEERLRRALDRRRKRAA